jgi:hypothetical protein
MRVSHILAPHSLQGGRVFDKGVVGVDDAFMTFLGPRRRSASYQKTGPALISKSAARDLRPIRGDPAHDGGRKVARPLMPAVSSGASPLITPITLIDWLTGSTRPPSRVTLAG